MSEMTTFFAALLSSVADFLAADPIIYLVGVFLLLALVKVLMTVIGMSIEHFNNT